MADSRHDEDKYGVFARFIHSEASGSVVLLACTLTALFWANSPWGESYFHLAHTKIAISFGTSGLALSLQHWVNDGLMAFFFFVVGLEIKRELVVGQLSSLRLAVLPVTAALGGMIVPAGFYALFNAGSPGAHGWGIPMATDIAFALGILALFGSRAPLGLKVFLTALAIADDLGAVLVIALFYTEKIHWSALAAAAVLLFLMAAAGRAGIRRREFYAGLSLAVWGALLYSGVHATVAGILVALLVPVRARIDPEEFFAAAQTRLDQLRATDLTQDSMIANREQLDAIDDVYQAAADMRPAGLVLEEALHPMQAFVILPLFALFNAGVRLEGDVLDVLTQPVSLGVVVGLALGKPIGIALFSWMAVRSGKAELPDGVNWGQLLGVACLAGVGFTMSLFISELAFSEPEFVATAKVGILLASLVSAVVGFAILSKQLPAARPSS